MTTHCDLYSSHGPKAELTAIENARHMSDQPLQHAGGKDRGNDRRLYIWMAIFIPSVVLIGFARTYYLKWLFGDRPLPSLLVHLHGIVMTSWVILFVTQVSLVAARRTALHRRLGIAGAVLAAAVVLVGVATGISAVARGGSSNLAGLRFLVIPLADMLVFAILIGTALHYRNRPEIHKRLMLVGALTLVSAAIARIPLPFIAAGGPPV